MRRVGRSSVLRRAISPRSSKRLAYFRPFLPLLIVRRINRRRGWLEEQRRSGGAGVAGVALFSTRKHECTRVYSYARISRSLSLIGRYRNGFQRGRSGLTQGWSAFEIREYTRHPPGYSIPFGWRTARRRAPLTLGCARGQFLYTVLFPQARRNFGSLQPLYNAIPYDRHSFFIFIFFLFLTAFIALDIPEECWKSTVP